MRSGFTGFGIPLWASGEQILLSNELHKQFWVNALQGAVHRIQDLPLGIREANTAWQLTAYAVSGQYTIVKLGTGQRCLWRMGFF
jgi:hypothetical protein